MWLGAAVMVAFIYAYQSASANPSDSYIVRIVQSAYWLSSGYSFFDARASISWLTRFAILGDQLQIRRGKIIEVCRWPSVVGGSIRDTRDNACG